MFYIKDEIAQKKPHIFFNKPMKIITEKNREKFNVEKHIKKLNENLADYSVRPYIIRYTSSYHIEKNI
jgi:hypothetical protein